MNILYDDADTQATIRPSASGGTALRVLSVASGKGGVGKTAVASNLAVALATAGKRVLVIDADLGLANIDVLFGLNPQYNLNHFFSGERTLAEILMDGPRGIKILPAGSGVQQLAHLNASQKLSFLESLDELPEEFDFVIIDTEAGISENVTYFSTAAHDLLVVTTPDPTAITDAYVLIKLLATQHQQKCFNLVVNMVRDAEEGLDVFQRLASVASRHLNVSLDYLGCIPFEKRMRDAVRRQKPILELYPEGKSSLAIRSLAENLPVSLVGTHALGNLQFFWRRLMAAGGGGSR